MLASTVTRLLVAEIAFLSTVDPCVRIADFVVCTQKGLAPVLFGHGWDGTGLAPNCIAGTVFVEALPHASQRPSTCFTNRLGEKLVPAIL